MGFHADVKGIDGTYPTRNVVSPFPYVAEGSRATSPLDTMAVTADSMTSDSETLQFHRIKAEFTERIEVLSRRKGEMSL